MARARIADDKLLTLLAVATAPMETSAIAGALNWSRQHALEVGKRLASEKRVVLVEGERNGSLGRPALLFALPTMALQSARLEAMKLEKDTYVVTPSGAEARVVKPRAASFVEIEYMTGPERFTRTTLHHSLLRAFQPGRGRPMPVRLPGAVEE